MVGDLHSSYLFDFERIEPGPCAQTQTVLNVVLTSSYLGVSYIIFSWKDKTHLKIVEKKTLSLGIYQLLRL